MTPPCPVCGAALPVTQPAPACRCPACGALANLETAPLDYSGGGGQDVPDGAKHAQRLDNARRRLALIAPHLAKADYRLVDIGAGSGEMVEAGQARLGAAMGFEPNRRLAAHAQGKGLAIVAGGFDGALVPRDGRATLYTLCHVLEHLDNPIALLSAVAAGMGGEDRLYVEVPSWQGASFARKGFGWKLWYAEHLALWADETCRLTAERAGLRPMAEGCRVFAGDSRNPRLLAQAVRHPLRAAAALPALAGGYPDYLDRLLGDYRWIVLGRAPA